MDARLQVLIVEDDYDLAESVMEYLELLGMTCDHAGDGAQALRLIRETAFDAIILDLTLPRLDGLAVCREMRAAGLSTPCLMLTARDALAQKLEGFEAGANDYLVKPFDMEELVARLRALCRRQIPGRLISVGDLTLDPSRMQAARGRRVLALSRQEWTLLLELAGQSPAVVTRGHLEDRIWPEGAPSKDALKMALHRLRQELDGAGEAQLLHVIRGLGVALRTQEDPA